MLLQFVSVEGWTVLMLSGTAAVKAKAEKLYFDYCEDVYSLYLMMTYM